MAEESDGIAEAIEGQLRLLLVAAAQVGEQIARARELSQRRAAATGEQEARELTSRLAAEQKSARAQLAQVYRSDWWDKASEADIARTYETATAWAVEEPEAARAQERIVDELKTRYGLDPDQLRAQVAQAQRERDQAAEAKVAAKLAARRELDAAKKWAAQAEPDAYRTYTYDMMGSDDVSSMARIDAALVDLYRKAHGIEGPQPTAPQPEAGKGAAAVADPTFTIQFTDYRDGTPYYKTVQKTKAEALDIIDRYSEDQAPSRDVKSWLGKDPDVDRAIVAKFPELADDTARSNLARADHEASRGAAERAEAVVLVSDATRSELRADDALAAVDRDPGDHAAVAGAAEHSSDADAARDQAAVLYDSAERRESTAAEYKAAGLSDEQVAVRMRADVSQGKPATEAVAPKGRGKVAKARRTSRGRAAQVQRSGPER